MSAVGRVLWVDDESLIDSVTGVSGSGPAYFFKVMELMMQAAEAEGLDRESARTLVVETALGAATLIQHSDLSPAELRRQVTSPGGTTHAGITQMEAAGIDDAITQGVRAAVLRSIELSDQTRRPLMPYLQDALGMIVEVLLGLFLVLRHSSLPFPDLSC